MLKELINAGIVLLATILREQIIKQKENGKVEKNKRKWIRRWIERRDKYGASTNLLRELSCEDPSA